MKFIKKRTMRWDQYPTYHGTKNKVKFKIGHYFSDHVFWVSCSNKEKSYNTLWDNKTFASMEEAQDFCENFKL